MKAKATLFGHPIHQALIVLPLGLLFTADIFNLIYLITLNEFWVKTALGVLAPAGVLGGCLAAPFGLIDWLQLPKGSRARQIGAAHGIGNGLVLLMFAYSWWVWWRSPFGHEWFAIWIAMAGGALALVTGWLGRELVDRFHIGIREDGDDTVR